MRVAPEPPFDARGDRLAAEEQEHRVRRQVLCLVVCLSPESDALQVRVAADFGDMRRRSNRDPGMLVDPLDKVTRHPLAEAGRADYHDDGARVLSHVKRCLAGRVAAAHDHHVAAVQPNRLSWCGAVVDPGTDELLDPGASSRR